MTIMLTDVNFKHEMLCFKLPFANTDFNSEDFSNVHWIMCILETKNICGI